MPTYIIGDIQGCYDSLQALLHYIHFDREDDRLWLVGDLVNRGPRSGDVLRWARDLDREQHLECVLGNHDLHLLLRYAGATKQKKRDTLSALLEADDIDELMEWLRMRPLIHVDDGTVMVHAGLHPQWAVDDAVEEAAQVEALLRADNWRELVGGISSKHPAPWSRELTSKKRIKAAAAVLMRMRSCHPDGTLCADFAGPPRDLPSGCKPWFKIDTARWRDHTVFFGHWSALGLFQGRYATCLDSGCVWGGALSACRLDDGEIFQVHAVENSYSSTSPS